MLDILLIQELLKIINTVYGLDLKRESSYSTQWKSETQVEVGVDNGMDEYVFTIDVGDEVVATHNGETYKLPERYQSLLAEAGQLEASLPEIDWLTGESK